MAEPVRDEYEWRVWECADCETEEGPPPCYVAHTVLSGASWERAPDIDECPRCGSRHSFVPRRGIVVFVSVDGRQVGPH